ncbi:MAG: DUF503 domain-containing protein [Nitrospirae bacterium]|nr:DUF503 domain-containing protein [Nitrospirota bacterium]MBI5096823.1 DUF503 domain-containing protein [Nitrospirota bacterium]
MIVGICTVELHIPDSGSLKGKRQVIKSIKDRIRQNYNVSVAEIDGLDLWQKAVLGIACVGNEKRYINGVLDKIVGFLQDNHFVELLKYHIEFL